MKKSILIILLFGSAANVYAEPWIDTRDPWLRADVEYLSDVGVIKSPITTWPLMWAPILQDLDDYDIQELSEEEIKIFRRVKRKGKFETKLTTRSYLSIKAGNEGNAFRHFGDDRREEAEITSRTSGVSKNFAWNVEATRTYNPVDGEENRLDHSYVAAVWGNWVLSAGAQERWWGPSWDSSLILSNNARPIPALSVHRNYSDAFETPWLSWIGPWSMNAFMGKLESDRHVPHAKLFGMSVSFKPVDSLEIGLRRTAQWGGEGRPQSLSTFIDLFLGRDNCDEAGLSCEDRSQEPGNQLAGLDFNWQIMGKHSLGSVYGQLIGEDEAGYAPARKFFQVGYKKSFHWNDFLVSSYFEYADTENDIGGNVTYNNAIYQTGYRTEGRVIGSTYDNDTQSLSFGLLLNHVDGDKYTVKLSTIDMNSDNDAGNHSITPVAVKFNQVELKYQKPTQYGLFSIEVRARDKELNPSGPFSSKNNISVSWTMEL